MKNSKETRHRGTAIAKILGGTGKVIKRSPAAGICTLRQVRFLEMGWTWSKRDESGYPISLGACWEGSKLPTAPRLLQLEGFAQFTSGRSSTRCLVATQTGVAGCRRSLLDKQQGHNMANDAIYTISSLCTRLYLFAETFFSTDLSLDGYSSTVSSSTRVDSEATPSRHFLPSSRARLRMHVPSRLAFSTLHPDLNYVQNCDTIRSYTCCRTEAA